MSIPTVSTAFMEAVFEYLADRGVDEARVLKALGLEDKQQLVFNARVPLRDYEQLFEIGQVLTGDEYFGLNMGASPMPRTWGLVSHLAMSAPNALLAVTALMNYSKLQLDFVHFTVNAAADDEVVLSSHIDVPRRPSRHVIEHMFANIMKLANSQVGYQAIRQRIEFMHEDAGNPQHVERVLSASVSFGCGSDLIIVPAQFFKQQSRYGQEDLFPITEELARQRLMEFSALGRHYPWQVSQTHLSPAAMCSIEDTIGTYLKETRSRHRPCGFGR